MTLVLNVVLVVVAIAAVFAVGAVARALILAWTRPPYRHVQGTGRADHEELFPKAPRYADLTKPCPVCGVDHLGPCGSPPVRRGGRYLYDQDGVPFASAPSMLPLRPGDFETAQQGGDGQRSDAPDHRGPGWPVNGAPHAAPDTPRTCGCGLHEGHLTERLLSCDLDDVDAAFATGQFPAVTHA